MVWARYDDGVRTHPKILRAGPLGGWLWFSGNSYCSEHLTDGFIPEEAVATLASFEGIALHGAPVDAKGIAAVLVKVGLWERIDGGFHVHDYLDYNPSRREVLRLRRDRAEAGRRGGLRKAANPQETAPDKHASNPLASAQASAQATPVATAKQNGSKNVPRTRTRIPYPDPGPDPVPDPAPSGGKTPQTPLAPLAGFEAFWAAYPNKVGKDAARTAWRKRHPTAELTAKIVAAVEAQKSWPKWQEGFIPNPATWLNQGRWQDEPPREALRLTPKTAGNAEAARRFAARTEEPR